MTSVALVLLGFVAGLVGFGIGYFAVICLRAWAEVKAAPREAMIFCAKHGPIREKYTIDFMGTKNCSICFHERLSQAEGGKSV